MTIDDGAGVRSATELLSAWIEAQMAYAGLPGLSIGIVHDQTVVWARGFGWADVERKVPATPETLYRIASITKLFTATAILKLRDAGRLRLDDPVATHLPWFGPAGGDSPITVRHLLTHTSGLAREAPFPYWTDGVFPDIDAINSSISARSRVLMPDVQWKYSNLAVTLSGEIVASVSGEPWADYVRQRILEPLGMGASLVAAPAPDWPALARGYGRRLPSGHRGLAPWVDINGLGAAGGMSSSVADLARFAMFHLRPHAAGSYGIGADDARSASDILVPATRREMQRVHWLEPGWEAGWGLGFRIQRLRGKTYVGHAGALRGYRTEFRLCPADRMAVIVLTNADDGEPARYVEKAFEWVGPSIVRASSPAAPPPAPDPHWQRYVGRYRNPWGDHQILVLDGRLTLIGPALPDPMETRATLVPTGEHTFRVETEHGFGIPGEQVVFQLDPSGRVTRVKLGENYAEPVEVW